MKTFIITAHEEEYSDKSRTLGVLLNINENSERIDSLVYIYHKGMYIFFNTMIAMTDYLLYGKYSTMERAYINEDDFDKIFDAPYINGKFSEQLKWS